MKNSVIIGHVMEVGELWNGRHGGKIKTSFGTVRVGKSKSCVAALAPYLAAVKAVAVEVDNRGHVVKVSPS